MSNYNRPTAKWQNRAQHNDHLWAECSNCGRRIENYKAIVTGLSSDDYLAVQKDYQYCPRCGCYMTI